MLSRKILVSAFILAGFQINPAIAQTFTAEDILQWQSKSFEGDTVYSVNPPEQNGTASLTAVSKGTASGLFYEQKIDLDKTPWLSWSWRINEFPTTGEEQTKPGDDFAARIYIVVKDGWTILSTKAISYVWSQQYEPGSTWPNPFTGDKAMMVSVEDGPKGQWREAKRNIKNDLKQLFGKDFRYINAIAIMTDTDNSNSQAIAEYGPITLSDK